MGMPRCWFRTEPRLQTNVLNTTKDIRAFKSMREREREREREIVKRKRFGIEIGGEGECNDEKKACVCRKSRYYYDSL